jgi:hypothetical protein
MEQKLCGIYCLTAPNGKIYVGQSTDLKKRYKQFFEYNTRSGYPSLENEVKVYPREQWRHEILCYCSKAELDELEKFWIKELDATNPERGYNKTLGGKGMLGIRHTEETKKRISKSNPRIWLGVTGENHPMFGRLGAASNTHKVINQYSHDGSFIRSWHGSREPERELGIDHSNIAKCCKGNPRYSKVGGFIWRYVDEVGSNDPLVTD